MSELETAADPGPADGSPFPPVGRAESGQKLLQFLQRRLNLPPALLHRWIRTGQARLNGRRAKPFARVSEGDLVRVPPFAAALAAQAGAPLLNGSAATPPEAGAASASSAALPPLPPLIGSLGDIWAFNKPAGLPTHPGTGHADSLSSRLAAHAPGAAFPPTPAHRLDKDTSGILLVAATHDALRALQEGFRERRIHKEYVAWVAGRWPFAGPRLLRAHLRKEGPEGAERMRVCAPGTEPAPNSREALCVVRPLKVGDEASLLQIRLITGRTHQIRVQLADLGHPVLGDAKYGRGRRDACPGLCLHALRVTLPDGRALECLPDWPAPHGLDALPAPMPLTADEAAVKTAPAQLSPHPAAGPAPGAPH
ncbi:MAG: RluA family pseudouridine synthase [Desulfovibrio sp.]|nr:RluA family pseudouridine synthase [Desulfovibrio sp.]